MHKYQASQTQLNSAISNQVRTLFQIQLKIPEQCITFAQHNNALHFSDMPINTCLKWSRDI